MNPQAVMPQLLRCRVGSFRGRALQQKSLGGFGVWEEVERGPAVVQNRFRVLGFGFRGPNAEPTM